MKHMKKGFTLIELLAVIAILAIILLVAVPSIINAINNVKTDAFVKDEQMMVSATKNYLAANLTLVPANIGDTIEVKLTDLQSNNLITTIKDPKNNNNTCNGYIIVTKLDNVSYDYAPHLNCDNNIGDLITDKLIAHYKFDDFQEPTSNIAANPTQVGGSGYSNYLISLDFNNITDPIGGLNATKMTTTTNGQARTEFAAPSPVADTYYTFSVYAKRGSTPYAALGTYFLPYNSPAIIANLDTGQITYSTDVISSSIESVGNGWWRIAMTVLVKPDQTHRLFKIMQTSSPTVTSDGIAGNYVYYWGAQLEEKNHLTPFTPTSRSGTLKDYSGNNKTTSLQLSSTPTWVNTGYNGGGAYQFNGSTNYITLPNDLVTNANIRTNGITYSAWIKPASLISQRIFGQQIAVGYSDYSSGGLGISGTSTAQMTAYSDSGPAEYLHAIGTTTLTINNWYNVVGTFDPATNELKIYVNGQLDGPSVLVGVYSRLLSNTSNRIGNKDHLTAMPYNGLIDDLKIYNRALSENEIKNIYLSEKTRSK